LLIINVLEAVFQKHTVDKMANNKNVSTIKRKRLIDETQTLCRSNRNVSTYKRKCDVV